MGLTSLLNAHAANQGIDLARQMATNPSVAVAKEMNRLNIGHVAATPIAWGIDAGAWGAKQVGKGVGNIVGHAGLAAGKGIKNLGTDVFNAVTGRPPRPSTGMGFGTKALLLGAAVPAALATANKTKGVYENLERLASFEYTGKAANNSVGLNNMNETRMNVATFVKTAAAGQNSGSGNPLFRLVGGVPGKMVEQLGAPVLSTTGMRINRALNPNVTNRVDYEAKALEQGAGEFGKGIGSAMAEMATGMFSGGVNRAQDAIFGSQQRKAILAKLMQQDPVISRADPEIILKAYHTMKRFAPTLSTDINAVQSFLREAAVHDGTINYNTLGALSKAEADAQKAIAGVV